MKKIYLQKNSTISPLKEELFEKELILQELLEKHPHLLPSEEIIGNPTFMTIKRELPVSVGYIDLLLIDQMMVPTVVETKVNNPEIRRKIIGQGYEYLTSLSYELTGKQIVDFAKSHWKDDYEQEVKNKLGVDNLSEKEIDKNLKKPRMRLIFVADFIPRELRKFVEFINNVSRGIDVYAVQIERFLLEDNRIISVSTWGPTESVIHDKTTSFGLMSREEFINKINKNETLSSKEKTVAIERISQIFDLVEYSNFEIKWATKSAGIIFKDKNENRIGGLGIFYNGQINIDYAPFDQRSEFWNLIYEKFDKAVDLQKTYLKNSSYFKQGRHNFFNLTEEQFSILLSTLKEVLGYLSL